jgi:hypothetical protein
MELIIDDRKIEVSPLYIIYEIEGTEESELAIRIKDKKDRDYVFTHLIRNKLIKEKKNG